MNISLTKQLSEYVGEKVASGMYNSASEVMREALRLMKQQDHLRQARIEALRQDIQAGLESGDSVEFSTVSIQSQLEEPSSA